MEIPQNVDVREITCYWTWMGEDGVAVTKVKPGAEIGLEEAKENSDITDAFYQERGEKFPLLIDSVDIKSMTREARQHFAVEDRQTGILAMAIIVGSPLSRIIANFFMGLQHQGVPCKVFTDEEKARKWLDIA